MKGKVGMDFMTTTKEQPLADSMHMRVTRRDGGGLPSPFSEIGKKCRNLGKICSDCSRLWVKFFI